MNSTVFGVLLCLAIAITEGHARWCYTCTSKRDPRCADPFHSNNASALKHLCTDDSSHSMHIHHHTNHVTPVCKKSVRMVHGEEVILRSCEWDRQTACPSNVDSSSEETFCATCEADGCNHGTPTVPVLGFKHIFQFVIWVFFMRFLK